MQPREGAVRLRAAFAFKFESGKDACQGNVPPSFCVCECVFKKKDNNENFCSLAF